MPYDLFVLGNAVVDRLMQVEQDVPAKHGLELGSGDFFRTPDQIDDLINQHGPGDLVSGGASANIGYGAAQLGSKVFFFGPVGDDDAGLCFHADNARVHMEDTKPKAGGRTMEVLCLITPDAQRTFASCGVQLKITPESVDAVADKIRASKKILIDGYMLFDQADAAFRAAEIARESGVKIVLTLASVAVLEHAWPTIARLIEEGVDLLFANEDEMAVLLKNTEEKGGHSSAEELAEAIHATARVVTHGADGAHYFDGKGDKFFAACPKLEKDRVIDTTGAGDSFAAGFLHGFVAGHDPISAMKIGHNMARHVVQQIGARLPSVDVQDVKKVA